jgi:hypothetical protein
MVMENTIQQEFEDFIQKLLSIKTDKPKYSELIDECINYLYEPIPYSYYFSISTVENFNLSSLIVQ